MNLSNRFELFFVYLENIECKVKAIPIYREYFIINLHSVPIIKFNVLILLIFMIFQ